MSKISKFCVKFSVPSLALPDKSNFIRLKMKEEAFFLILFVILNKFA